MSKYGVFIIEFLRADDYNDGYNLGEILELSLIDCEYIWVDTREELENALIVFSESQFRYLHISCHADETGIELNDDDISNLEFQQMTKKYLKNKRLFMSACKAANRQLASLIISKNKARSFVAIPTGLDFDKSALFWPMFYHLINELDSTKMVRLHLVEIITKLVKLLNIPVNYYSRIDESSTHMRRLKIRPEHADNRKVKILC